MPVKQLYVVNELFHCRLIGRPDVSETSNSGSRPDDGAKYVGRKIEHPASSLRESWNVKDWRKLVAHSINCVRLNFRDVPVKSTSNLDLTLYGFYVIMYLSER